RCRDARAHGTTRASGNRGRARPDTARYGSELVDLAVAVVVDAVARLGRDERPFARAPPVLAQRLCSSPAALARVFEVAGSRVNGHAASRAGDRAGPRCSAHASCNSPHTTDSTTTDSTTTDS